MFLFWENRCIAIIYQYKNCIRTFSCRYIMYPNFAMTHSSLNIVVILLKTIPIFKARMIWFKLVIPLKKIFLINLSVETFFTHVFHDSLNLLLTRVSLTFRDLIVQVFLPFIMKNNENISNFAFLLFSPTGGKTIERFLVLKCENNWFFYGFSAFSRLFDGNSNSYNASFL